MFVSCLEVAHIKFVLKKIMAISSMPNYLSLIPPTVYFGEIHLCVSCQEDNGLCIHMVTLSGLPSVC